MMKILVVEDDEMILRTLGYRLKKDGYTVTAIKDDKKALEQLQSNTFNLVITDLMLPFVTGLEILSYVKSELPKFFFILSGADEEGSIMDAFNIGADNFITKPFSPGELFLRVKHLLISYAKKNDVLSVLWSCISSDLFIK